MSEEIKNPSLELSDEELDTVSGGKGGGSKGLKNAANAATAANNAAGLANTVKNWIHGH